MPASTRKGRGNCRSNALVVLSTWVASVLLLNVFYIHNNLPPMVSLMAAHNAAWEKHRKVRDLTYSENLITLLHKHLLSQSDKFTQVNLPYGNHILATLTQITAFPDKKIDDKVCFTPSRIPACAVHDYDLFAIVESEIGFKTSPRTLLLNCLKWLLDPSVRFLFLILPNATKPLLEADKAYGRRILRWSQMSSHHRVRVIFGHNPVSDGLVQVGRALEEHHNLPILWMNASSDWNEKRATLQNMLQMWRRKPDRLMAKSIWVRTGASDLDSVWSIKNPKNTPQVGSWLVDMNAVLFHPSYFCILLRTATILRNIADVASVLSQAAAASRNGWTEDDQPFMLLNSTTTGSGAVGSQSLMTALFVMSPRPFSLKNVSYHLSNHPDCK